MKVTWIIQTNVGSQSDIQTYVDGVKASGADVIEVAHFPFLREIPDINIAGPMVFYGAVNFIREVQQSGRWPLGVFGTSETFTYQAWAEHYGAMLLNSPDCTTCTTIGEFSASEVNPGEYIFVRPQHDTKSLVGRVWTAGEFKEWCAEAEKGAFAEVSKDTEIVVGTPHGIEAEWRLFIVGGKVISASQYRENGKFRKAPGAPQDIMEFATEAVKQWNPVPAYTLDLCRSAGNCYIVEAQGFNSAGHYACDIAKVATAVNEVVVELWQARC